MEYFRRICSRFYLQPFVSEIFYRYFVKLNNHHLEQERRRGGEEERRRGVEEERRRGGEEERKIERE